MSTTTKRNRSHKKQEVVESIANMQLLGEVITWRPGNGSVTHSQVLEALKAEGFEEKVEKELSSESAFARAAKKLEKDLDISIHKTQDYQDEIVYQVGGWVSAQDDGETGLDYKRKAFLRVSDAFKVKCKVPEIAQKAQEELDRCKEARTGSDITGVVQRLIEGQPDLDLFAIRDQGGAYFVFAQHTTFIAQLHGFLSRLGGKVNRFPVPQGTQIGEAAVQDAVSEGLARMISDHEGAIDALHVHTRQDTIQAAADKINGTRVKIEAYAHYLADKREDLLKALEEANTKLVAKIDTLAVQRSELPPEQKSRAQDINQCLQNPKTLEEIAIETGLSKSRIRHHLNYWIPKGRIVENNGKYSFSTNGIKKNKVKRRIKE